MSDPVYTVDVAMPFQFTEDCNIALDVNERLVDQGVKLAVQVMQGSIPLFSSFGSQVPASIFDPLDDETELVIDSSIRNSINNNEPRAYLDQSILFDQSADESRLVITIPYRIVITGELTATKLTLRKVVSG